MNIEKNLILIKNEDKAEEITHCSPITNGKRNVTYKNNKTTILNGVETLLK